VAALGSTATSLLATSAAHRWTWDPGRLDEIVAEADRECVEVLWMCGHVANAFQVAAHRRRSRRRRTRHAPTGGLNQSSNSTSHR
jgi:hypothetical protein